MLLKEVLRHKRQGCETRACLGHRVCSHFCRDMLCDPEHTLPSLDFLLVKEGVGPDDP